MKNEKREDILIMEGRRYLNVAQICRRIGISRKTFYKREYDQQLTPHHFRGYLRTFYAEDEVNTKFSLD